MSARQPEAPPEGTGERRVSDQDIVGWVTQKVAQSPDEEARKDVTEIIRQHAGAVREAWIKLTLGA